MGSYRNIGTPGRFFFISVFLGFLLLPGCSPKIVEKVRTEYVYQTVTQHDTTIVKDSVYIKEWMKGDTVYLEKYKDRFVYRDRWRDSIQIVERHDTTQVEVKVEKPLTKIQKAKIGAFPWLVGALLIALLYVFRKPILKLLKTLI
jgi:hypothetical protein